MDDVENCNAWVCNIMHGLGGPPCPKEGEAGAEGDAAAEGGEEKKEEGGDEKKEKEIIEQPIYMLPLPSPICRVDFNYNLHGEDWKCGCND